MFLIDIFPFKNAKQRSLPAGRDDNLRVHGFAKAFSIKLYSSILSFAKSVSSRRSPSFFLPNIQRTMLAVSPG